MRFLLLMGTIIWHVASSEVGTARQNHSEALRAAIQSANTFGQKLDRYVFEKNKGNLVFSSLNAWILTAMAASGTRQLTNHAVQKAFALPQDEKDAMSELEALTKSMKYEFPHLLMTNKIFLDQTIAPKEEFHNMMKKVFHSEVSNVNFSDPNAARRIINKWPEIWKNNSTKDVVTPAKVNSTTTMVLAGAVHFQGARATNQEFHFTREEYLFLLKDSLYAKMNFTCSYGTHTVYWSQALQNRIEEIPLTSEGVNDALSMYVIRSSSLIELATIESKMEKFTMHELPGDFLHSYKVCVPEFKIESEIELNNVFETIATDSFSKINTNFFGISDSRNISDPRYVQKTVIEVGGGSGAPVHTYGNRRVSLRESQECVQYPSLNIIWKPFIGVITARGNISAKFLTFRYTGPTVVDPPTYVFGSGYTLRSSNKK